MIGVYYVTPFGHVLIADGGCRPVPGDNLLIATSSPLFGWHVPVEVREIPVPQEKGDIVIAERSTLVAYEQLVGSVTLAGSL